MLSEVALPELPILTNEGQSIEVCVTITDSQLISGSATVTLTSQGTDDTAEGKNMYTAYQRVLTLALVMSTFIEI